MDAYQDFMNKLNHGLFDVEVNLSNSPNEEPVDPQCEIVRPISRRGIQKDDMIMFPYRVLPKLMHGNSYVKTASKAS